MTNELSTLTPAQIACLPPALEGSNPKRRADAREAVWSGGCAFWIDVLGLGEAQRRRVEHCAASAT